MEKEFNSVRFLSGRISKRRLKKKKLELLSFLSQKYNIVLSFNLFFDICV